MKSVWLLLHHDEPIGIIVMGMPSISNSGRNRAFGRTKWTGKQVNALFTNMSRVVLDPRYRGAGIAGDFMRAVAMRSDTRFVELITSMGTATRFWQKAGFVDYGKIKGNTHGAYGSDLATSRTATQSALSQMRYYLFDKQRVLKESNGMSERRG